MVELVAAARDEAGPRGDGDLGVVAHRRPGLVDDRPADRDLAGEDGGTRLGPAREEAPVDEDAVESPTRHDRARPSARARARPGGCTPSRRRRRE